LITSNLRKIDPEAARKAVLEYLHSNGHNISQVALVFGVNRAVIYDILRKEEVEGGERGAGTCIVCGCRL